MLLYVRFFVLLACPLYSFGLVEISGDYGYDKSVYGKNKQDKKTDRTYSSGFAFYLFNLTAIELLYSQSKQTTFERPGTRISNSDFIVDTAVNTFITSFYGISLKQAFASRKSAFRPSMSLGYAKLLLSDQKNYTFVNSATGTKIVHLGQQEKTRDDSFYMGLALQMRLTRFLSLKFSLQSVMPDFEFDKAGDTIKYLIGFSWFL